MKAYIEKREKMAEIITMSCGIGRSFKEAMVAVTKAKKSKTKFNLKFYEGRKLRSKIHKNFKKRAKDYFNLAKTLSKEQIKALQSFSFHDPITGMLNKTGFVIKLEELKKRGITKGYYILFDLDDLHYWNSKLGYLKVDEYLEMIGREIVDTLRSRKLSTPEERVVEVVGHRLNESAGDEFLIFISLKQCEKSREKIKEVVHDILKRVYEKQSEIK